MWVHGQQDQRFGHWSPPSPQGHRISLPVCSTALQPRKARRKDKGPVFWYQYRPLKLHLASSCVDLIQLSTSISIVLHSNTAFAAVVAKFPLKPPKDGHGHPLFR